MDRSLPPLAVALLIALGHATAEGADVVVGAPAPPGQQVSMAEVDHTAWGMLLGRFVDDQGLVDYRGWKGSPESRAALTDYLRALSAADPSRDATRAERLAFWINAYNALTVEGILREYPTTSIKNHAATLWGYNIWKNLLLPVGDRRLSLDDIEHRTLRPMGEPRVHFALVCASIGCPRLLNRAYTADRLEGQLETNARHFFAQPKSFRADPATKSLHLSPILKWYGEDFGAGQAERLKSIARWLPDAESKQLAADPGVRVRYLGYDWGLNEQP